MINTGYIRLSAIVKHLATVLVIFFLAGSYMLNAQTLTDNDLSNKSPKDKISGKKRGDRTDNPQKRFFFGGMVGLRFGTITDIQLAPVAGCRLTPRLEFGVGFKYQYYSERNPLFKYNTNIYGPRVFTRYLFLKNFSKIFPIKYNGGLFFDAEYETLSMEKKYFDFPAFNPEGRFWLKSYLVGIGLRQPVDRNRALNLILLYNLNDVQYTPYSNPMFRIEFTF
ncbi:MAG: hypothetical protein GXO83_00855 [Chlorobi bacterium]|nr:hypothetical protein [Chlorobiota bacterium]